MSTKIGRAVVVLTMLASACAAETGADGVRQYNAELSRVDTQAKTATAERARIRAWAATKNAPAEDVVARVIGERNEFDCIPWEKQRSVRGTGLRRADIVPPPPLSRAKQALAPAPGPDIAEQLGQTPATDEYQRAPDKCPDGTVPIRHITDAELGAFATLAELEASFAPKPHIVQCDLSNPKRYYENYGAEFAVGMPGAHARVLVDDSVGVAAGHSIGQIWLSVNHHPCSGVNEPNLETIESGWVKRSTGGVELFVYSTPDGYNTFCWNFDDCVGSIQGLTNVNGGGILPGSTMTNGYLDMAWHLYWPANAFGVTPGWWFYANGWVGFYSLSNYDQGLQDGASLVMVGGEITLNAGTRMGNGNWGIANNNASYVDRWWYLDWNYRYRNYTNAQYWGVGRWTSIVNGKRMVDGREVPGWETSGTYSTPIANNATFFWFGGPGAFWN